MTHIPTQVCPAGRCGWSAGEVALFRDALRQAEARGSVLQAVFDDVAARTGRMSSSVRNYYYTHLRSEVTRESRGLLRRERPRFVPFSPEETRQLLREVLSARARGESVRACTLRLAGGDRSRMLRYQNKFRTLMASRPPLVEEVEASLRREGILPAEAVPPLAGVDLHALLPEAWRDLIPEGAPETLRISSVDLPALVQGLRSLMALAVAGELAARRMEDMKAELTRLRRAAGEDG